jgi:hypothetical protein
VEGAAGLIFVLATTFPAQAQDATTLTDIAWYSMKYGVGLDKVHVQAKPENCDYYYAPVGYKGCHYERRVTTFNAEGIPVDSSWGNGNHGLASVYVQ